MVTARRPATTSMQGLLFCVLKKPLYEDAETGSVYSGVGTRPISVMDFSNRILAAAYKRPWEPLLSGWVSPAQRGFTPGRQMLDNSIELEHAMTDHHGSDGSPGGLQGCLPEHGSRLFAWSSW